MIGRPQLWGLATAGEEGVSWVLTCLRTEIDRAMALCGCERLSDVDSSVLFKASAFSRVAGDHALSEIV